MFLGKGSSKTPYKYFCKKSMPKNSTKLSMSAFPRLFCFIAVSGVSQRWELKNTTKSFTKKIVSKGFYKKFDQESKNCFFPRYFYRLFGRFSVTGAQKHHTKNINKKNLTLVLFWPLTHPPTAGVTYFFLTGPFGYLVNPGAGGLSLRAVYRSKDPTPSEKNTLFTARSLFFDSRESAGAGPPVTRWQGAAAICHFFCER
jgi:hypothetical protein